MDASFLLSSPGVLPEIEPPQLEQLTKGNITTIAELLKATPSQLARAGSAISKDQLTAWTAAGHLLGIPGMSPKLALMLARSRISTVRLIADADLQALEKIVQDASRNGLIESAPNLYELAALQRSACRRLGFGMLFGRVLDRDGQPLAGAKVFADQRVTHSTVTGLFAFDSLPDGPVSILVSVPGLDVALGPIPAEAQSETLTGPLILRLRQHRHTGKAPIIREIDGGAIVLTQATTVKLKRRKLEEAPEGDMLQIREIASDGQCRLLSYFRERVGSTLFIYQTRTTAAELPVNAKAGDILKVREGTLEPANIGLEELLAFKQRNLQKHATATHSMHASHRT